MTDLRPLCGHRDFVWVVFDSLRWDVAQRAWQQGRTPQLASLFPAWQKRHTPGNFTWPAHQAFFAGFLPTSTDPQQRQRNLALAFEGSSTLSPETLLLEGSNVCEGLRQRRYRTICVGGVGFFNRKTPLSCVLPDLFCESHWTPEMGVTSPISTAVQVERCLERLEAHPEQRVFLYLNISATHQPNCIHDPQGRLEDSPDTQLEALAYADSCLQPLWAKLRQRGAYCWAFSDHGTAYGEDGFEGHRCSHPVIWEVPYAEFSLSSQS